MTEPETLAGRELSGFASALWWQPNKLAGANAMQSATAEVREVALRAFVACRCDGMARVDCFYDEGGRGFVVNEVNTIPGFTPISMYPRLWAVSGLPYPALLDRLIELAIERHDRRAARAGRQR